MSTEPNIAKICAVFGCTPEQAKAQLAKNAEQLTREANEAKRRGGYLRGFSEKYLRERAKTFSKAAQS